MNKIKLVLLSLIFLGAIGVRLYRINGPVADWHSWRQADTAAVARNFIKFGFDPLRPRFDDLSNIPSGKDNPAGYRMVEFPLYQLIGASLYKLFPVFSIEIWLRVVIILLSSATAILIYGIVSQFIDIKTGILSAAAFAFLPYSIYYGRTILPDPFMVFWSVLSLYFGSLATFKKGKYFWILIFISALAGSIAVLAKPVGAFLLLPIIYLLLGKGMSKKSLFAIFIYGIICVIPLLLWRQWILQFPEGIPVFLWLFNEGNIRFKGAWFQWLFAKRLGELILGYWGLVPFGIGTALAIEKNLPAGRHGEGWFFRFWIFGALLYLIVIARGNVQHDYYQILLIPVISIYLGKGLAFLLSNKILSKTGSYILATMSVLFMLAFSWFTIRTYYWINRPEIVEAGRAADQLLPKNAKVIASYNGDTTFLYQINRQGWPLGFDIDTKIKMGATAYVTVSPTDNDGETKALASRFTVLVRNEKFAIIDLTKPHK